MIGVFNAHHKTLHGGQIVSFSLKPLVFSTIAVTQDELLSYSLSRTVQDFSAQLGHDEEGLVRLVIKVPLLVMTGWAFYWVAYDFGSIRLAGPFSIKHEPVEVSLDVNILLQRE